MVERCFLWVLKKASNSQTNGLQLPEILPRADMQPVVKLPFEASYEPPPTYPNLPDVTIVVEYAHAPSGLRHVRFVNSL